jgi:hypothetical protein
MQVKFLGIFHIRTSKFISKSARFSSAIPFNEIVPAKEKYSLFLYPVNARHGTMNTINMWTKCCILLEAIT